MRADGTYIGRQYGHDPIQGDFRVSVKRDRFRNSSFTGREEYLNRLHAYVSGSHDAEESCSRVVISGLGGTGKTQLALEYTYRHEESFDSNWWVNAQSLQSTQTDFLHIAQRLVRHYADPSRSNAATYSQVSRYLGIENLVDEDGEIQLNENPASLIVSAVKEWLCRDGNTRWLLVFDNVDDPESFNIRDFIPETRLGNIIMTSRCLEIERFGPKINLEAMLEEEGINLLSRACRREISKSDTRSNFSM